MTQLSAIFSKFVSGISLLAAVQPSLRAAEVTGRVLLVDSRDAAVRQHADYSGVVVSLRSLDPSAPPLKPVRAVMTQKNKTFTPHVLAIPAGSTVAFPNLDPIFHNAFSSYNGDIFDLGLYPPGKTRSFTFVREGAVRVFCNIHSEMSAMIVVLPTPYFAVTRHDGSFAISGVPPGDYELRFMQERATEATLRALSRHVTVPIESLALPVVQISEAGHIETPHKNKYGHEYPHDPSPAGGYSDILK